jgi:hypothetical protein
MLSDLSPNTKRRSTLKIIQLLVIVFVLTGCANRGMVIEHWDENGHTKEVFINQYERGAWSYDKRIGMQVVVDHIPNDISFYVLKRWLGALDSRDLFAQGVVTIYLYNFTKEPIEYLWNTVSLGYGKIENKELNTTLLPSWERIRINIGQTEIANYRRDLEFGISFTIDEGTFQESAILQRLTIDDKRNFNSDKNKNPFPWLEKFFECEDEKRGISRD